MSAHLGRRGLAQLLERLSERDLDVIGSVAEHRFLTARQIEALHFSESHRRHILVAPSEPERCAAGENDDGRADDDLHSCSHDVRLYGVRCGGLLDS